MVITSLFYPALAVYSTSKPLSHFSSRWLEVLYGTSNSYTETPTTQLVDDLREVWRGLDSLVVVDDWRTMAKCSKGATVRLERLLIHRDNEPDSGALTKDTLLDALNIHETLMRTLKVEKPHSLLPCVRDGDGECLSTSPLGYWDTGEDIYKLNSTAEVLRRIGAAKGTPLAGIHLTPDMTLSGRSVMTHPRSHLRYARFLVLTYFFEEDDCSSNTRHNEWLQRLAHLRTSAMTIRHGTEPASLVALQVRKFHYQLRTLNIRLVRPHAYTDFPHSISLSLFGIHIILLLFLRIAPKDG